MKIISHRGNIVGPNPSRENTPSYIDTAISAGYEVEVDIRFINEKYYLGHDTPDYEVTQTWLVKRKDKLWIHCKNVEAANELSQIGSVQFFCHTSDPFVLTSNGFVWAHDLSIETTNRIIIPLLGEQDLIEYQGKSAYAACTDYVSFAKFILKQKGLCN
jgi:hypothetical protein